LTAQICSFDLPEIFSQERKKPSYFFSKKERNPVLVTHLKISRLFSLFPPPPLHYEKKYIMKYLKDSKESITWTIYFIGFPYNINDKSSRGIDNVVILLKNCIQRKSINSCLINGYVRHILDVFCIHMCFLGGRGPYFI
jgi:hypothetical protein